MCLSQTSLLTEIRESWNKPMAMGLLSSMDVDNDFTIFLVDGIMLISTYASPGQWAGHSVLNRPSGSACSALWPAHSHITLKECEGSQSDSMFHGRSWGPVRGTEVLARGPPFGKWFDSEFRAILHDSQTSATSIVLYTSLRWEWRHIKFKHTHTHTTHSIDSKPCLTDKYQMGTSWILDKGTCVLSCLCMCFMWAGRGHTAENTVGSCLCDLSSNNTESLGYMLESITIHRFHFSRDTLHKGSVPWNQ